MRHKQRRIQGTYKLKGNEEQVIDYERPLSPISISGDTEQNRTDGPEHKNERDAPGNVSCGLPERLGQAVDGERDGEEVEGVPSLYVFTVAH